MCCVSDAVRHVALSSCPAVYTTPTGDVCRFPSRVSVNDIFIHHHHHHIRFWYLRCCGCPRLQRLTLVLHEFLSNGLTPSRLHIVISFFTHADDVFLGLPRSLVPGSSNCVMVLMHEETRCTCPYHLRRRVRRTAVISSRSSFSPNKKQLAEFYKRIRTTDTCVSCLLA